MKTDGQLQEDVIEALEWEPSVDIAQLGVVVKCGIVTLSGRVGSLADKQVAERAAESVPGIKGLAIKIEVAVSRSTRFNDAGLAPPA